MDEDIHDPVKDLIEPEDPVLQFHLAGLDLRKIEDVVDDAEEGIGGILDDMEIVLDGLRHLFAQRQIDGGDDAVHRGADLMAHIGEEFALGPRRRLGQLLGPLQFLVQLPMLLDLLHQGDVRGLEPAVEPQDQRHQGQGQDKENAERYDPGGIGP